MRLAAREPHHLVFDRWAIARAGALNLAGIDWRTIKIGADDVMRLPRRPGDAASNLWRRDCGCQKGEWRRRFIACLHIQGCPINRAAIKARRRAGLQPPHAQAQTIKRFGQTDRRTLHRVRATTRGSTARGYLALADMDQPIQECAGGQNHSPGRDHLPVRQDDAGRSAVAQNQIFGGRFHDGQVRYCSQRGLHRLTIKLAVGLGARAAHRRALAPVQKPELDSRRIRDPAHQPIQRINLAHQMALAQPANRRVAGHLANGRNLVCQQKCASAHPRRGRRGFTAGVPAPDHDDIICAHALPYAHAGLWTRQI